VKSFSHAGSRLGATLALGILLLSACADEPTVVAPAASSSAVSAADERENLNELARAVALALQDQGLRQRVKNDLRESRFNAEHKLEFTRYLNRESGGILLAKMAKETGRSRAEMLALLGAVRPLEFYMPVQEHRESWRGGADLLVASLLDDESEAPVAFTLAGARLLLSPETPPQTPVLGLVPVETDFTRPLDPEVPNRNDQGGHTIGTYCETCLIEDGGSSGGGGSSKPAGLYMTLTYIEDDGEAWLKSAPEIEAHVHGLYLASDPERAKDWACSGAKQTGWRYFDQNDPKWTGDVLLFTKAQIDSANAVSNEGYNVMLWEDDDTACTIKLDNTTLTTTLKAIRDALKVVSVLLTTSDPTIQARALVAFTYENASWLLSDDEWLGVAVDKNYSGDSYTDATHRLEKRPDLTTGKPNGRVNLVRYGF
jgi:hypothetical protein